MEHSSIKPEPEVKKAERSRRVAPGGLPVPVALEDFVRAESDTYFAKVVSADGFGKLLHGRELTPIHEQVIVRMNRDTLYSPGIFDLDAGPVSLTLPDTGQRYLMAQIVNEDHFTRDIVYPPARRSYTRKEIGTRYMAILVRTMVDPRNPADSRAVAAVQDAIVVEQPGGPGRFEIPNWDQESLSEIRDALKVLGARARGGGVAFGNESEVDPAAFVIGTAMGWGGNPRSAAMYLNVVPRENDGIQVHEVIVQDVPVDAFWSLSVYNAQGYFEKNARDAYSVNSITAQRNPDGSVRVQFGGCGDSVPNCLPIMPGWNCTVRLYRPRRELLEGKWQFPEITPVD